MYLLMCLYYSELLTLEEVYGLAFVNVHAEKVTQNSLQPY